MSHPKLVLTTSPRKRRLSAPTGTNRPVPTPEFLARRILALRMGEQTIDVMLSEVARILSPGADEAINRCGYIIRTLMLVGIWISPATSADDPPTHGGVVRPTLLAKRYPELKRIVDQLAGLELMSSAA